MLWLSGFVLLATLASTSQVTSSTAEIPDLNLILQRMEDILHRDPAESLPYEVTREYKVFRDYNKRSTSEVMAQIDFVPPDAKTYRIIQARGNSSGERMVREILDKEARPVEQVLCVGHYIENRHLFHLRIDYRFKPRKAHECLLAEEFGQNRLTILNAEGSVLGKRAVCLLRDRHKPLAPLGHKSLCID
jgi:hypothetical protein